MSAIRFLDRHMGLGPYLTLVIDQAGMDAVCKKLRCPQVPRFVNSGSYATTHTFEKSGDAPACVIGIDDSNVPDPIEVAAILVHEAVHVWQQHCKDIGETNPGDEQEAYAIQFISSRLMREYTRQKAKAK